MNEKIDALVKKATIRVNNPILNSDGKIVVDDWEEGVSISMLAEFIIKECAKVAWYNTPDTEELEYSHLIKDKILKHFGVEE